MCSGLSPHVLQFLDCPDGLTYLVGFGHALVVLDVHSGIARPGGTIYAMAGASLPGLAKELVAYPRKIGEPDSSRIRTKPLDDLIG